MTAPTPTPPQYTPGAIRRNTSSLSVAIRTGLPTTDGTLDWCVMTVNYGGYYANWDEIGGANWVDVQGLYFAPAALGGDGTLSATVIPQSMAPAALGGDGALSATVVAQ